VVVAVRRKLASLAGCGKSPGDRVLVGVGIDPSREVGLISPPSGSSSTSSAIDVYAALLLVVPVDHLVAAAGPSAGASPSRIPASRWWAGREEPSGGWSQTISGPLGAIVDLVAEPPGRPDAAAGTTCGSSVRARSTGRAPPQMAFGAPAQSIAMGSPFDPQSSTVLQQAEPRSEVSGSNGCA